MSYRNKTYVAFNANYPTLREADMWAYNIMKAWKSNDRVDFDFHDAHDINNIASYSSDETIKRRLRERMNNTKHLIVLVGPHTRNMHKWVRWEQEIAIKMNIPIIAANLIGGNFSGDHTPAILKNSALFMNVPFGLEPIKFALNDFPAWFYAQGGHAAADSRRYQQYDNYV